MQTDAARNIGISFVKQYYKVLSSQTELVGKFYQDNSCFSYNSSKANGSQEIQNVYLEYGFGGMEMEINTGAFLPAHEGAILVVVTGTMTSKSGVLRKVSQTFLLAPFEEGDSSRLFVLNDILVCVDGPEFTLGGDKAETPVPEPPAPVAAVPESIVEAKAATETPKKVEEPEPVMTKKKSENEKSAAPPTPSDTTATPKKKADPIVLQKPVIPAVVSYAQMLSKRTSATNEATSTSTTKDSASSSTGSRHDIFVKDIQKDWNEEKLTLEFGKYGIVNHVHIPSNKKFAFVSFAEAASVDNVMQNGPVEIDGKLVVVETRQNKSEPQQPKKEKDVPKKSGAKDRPPRADKPKTSGSGNNQRKGGAPPAKNRSKPVAHTQNATARV